MPLNPESLPSKVIIPNDLTAARKVEDRIMRQVESMGYSPRCVFGIRLALEEALVNAYRHGNHGDESKRITVSYDIGPQRVVVRVRDDGPRLEGNQPTCSHIPGFQHQFPKTIKTPTSHIT